MAPTSRKKPKPAPPPAVKYSPQAIRDYERGLKLFHDGKFAEARDVFLALRDGQPGEPELKPRAVAYLQACETRLAVPPPEIPRVPDGLYLQAVLRTNDGRPEEAIPLLERARSQAPKDDRILYLLAVNHFRRAQRERALELLREAIRLRDLNRKLARNDPEFEEIREDRDFLQVVTGES